tara:strand:+ start:12 stop:638 length:627 start_codon:yes stop_codon:yes gene_type:complete
MELKIIDNFLENEDFEVLSKLELKKTGPSEINVYNNSIGDGGIIRNTCLEERLLENFYSKYHPKALKLLEELCPNKVKLYEYSEFQIIETGKDYKFPIHDDTPNKLLSGVIYLLPEKNTGTLFYDDKLGNNKKEVDWLQNRAVFFSREERKTWHSYEGDKISNRIALVYNLMTNNVEEVCKIEKTNYLLVKYRLKLNEHLYRFFKFTI